MPFQPNDPNINRSGKPPGAKTSVKIPVNTQRKIIRQLTERAEEGDRVSAEILAMLMLRGTGT